MPHKESFRLKNFLIKGLSTLKPSASEQDYLIDYPGFSSAYGLPLEIPHPGDNNWIECPELGSNSENNAVELARIIISTVNSLSASSKPNVILIFIPSRWKEYRQYGRRDRI
jgi:hypothetical protein